MEQCFVYSKPDKIRLLEAFQQRCRLAVLLTDALDIVFARPDHTAPSDRKSRLAQYTAVLDTTLLSLDCWSEEFPLVTTTRETILSIDKSLSFMSHLSYMLFQ